MLSESFLYRLLKVLLRIDSIPVVIDVNRIAKSNISQKITIWVDFGIFLYEYNWDKSFTPKLVIFKMIMRYDFVKSIFGIANTLMEFFIDIL